MTPWTFLGPWIAGERPLYAASDGEVVEVSYRNYRMQQYGAQVMVLHHDPAAAERESDAQRRKRERLS